METTSKRRLLVVGAPACGAVDVIKELTGTAPEPDTNGSFAGATHLWDVKTKYYSATVPIWIDEITDVDAWRAEFVKPEAKEVVEAVGGWICCFRLSEGSSMSVLAEEMLKAVQDVTEEHMGYEGEGVMLAIAMPSSIHAEPIKGEQREQWEDVCIQHGFEFVDFKATGADEFGEKQGIERLREALESNEWDSGTGEEEDDLVGLGFDDEDDVGDFGHEEAEMTAELFGMKAALMGGDDLDADGEDFMPPTQQKQQLDELEVMMSKLLAIREQGAGLPEAQKKRMAAQAVRNLLDHGEGS